MLAMGKLVTIFLLMSTLLGASAFPAAEKLSQPDETLLKTLKAQRNGNQISFGFCVHEIESGPNRTIWNVALSEITLNSVSSFGLIQVVDNLITLGPELNSFPLGRVQGTVSYADLRAPVASVNWNFIFRGTNSTLSAQGIYPYYGNPLGDEISIVGGTEIFWLAQGIAHRVDLSSGIPTPPHRVSCYQVEYTTGPLPPISRA